MTRDTIGPVAPALTTARLRLVAPDERHVADLFAYGSQPDFTMFLDSVPFGSFADAQRFLRSLQADNQSGSRLYWVAELATGGRAVGTLGFIFPFARRHRVAEIGYGFAPDTWGSGLFAEAARMVVAYGFGTLGLHRIQAVTRSANRRAIRGVEKIGFRREATFAEFYQQEDGSRAHATLLVLLASDPSGARIE